jgi:hypothetical protein
VLEEVEPSPAARMAVATLGYFEAMAASRSECASDGGRLGLDRAQYEARADQSTGQAGGIEECNTDGWERLESLC